MPSRPLTFKEIMEEVHIEHPDAGYEYCRRILNSEMRALATRFKMKFVADEKIDVVSGQQNYSIGDQDSGLGLNKLTFVGLLDSNSEYVQIPRLTNPSKLKFFDES